MKVTSSSDMFKTMYLNCSCLLLFGKKSSQSFEVSCE